MKNAILRDFRKVVTREHLERASLRHKFTQRSTAQIKGVDFIYMLLSQASSGSGMTYSNLNAALHKINPQVDISNQALAKYFYKQTTLGFVRSAYEMIFLYQRERLIRENPLDDTVLSLFKRILIEDSTICVLNEALEAKYKGSGGSASRSSVKIDAIQELKSATMINLSIDQGSKPDIANASCILEYVEEGDLILRDLGYCKLEVLAEITERGAFFISRFNPCTSVYLNANDKEPVDLGRFLKRKHGEKGVIDVEVCLGKEKKVRVRLIAYRISPDKSNERRRKAKRNAAKKGRTASEGYLNLLDYVILITNIPSEMVGASVIGTIYRIRWNIELMFKTWKSLFCLQISLKGYKKTCIECFIYTILILALLTMVIHKWLKSEGLDKVEDEISLERLVKWLINRQGFDWLLRKSVPKLEEELRRGLRHIKKQKRERKTTLERVAFEEAYDVLLIVANF